MSYDQRLKRLQVKADNWVERRITSGVDPVPAFRLWKRINRKVLANAYATN